MQTNLFISEFIPGSQAASEQPSKIMILMHGLGDSLDSYRDFCRELNVTGINYLLLNAPDVYFTGFSWYDTGTGPHYRGLEESRRKLLLLIDELHQSGYAYDEIFVAGFSQGARMSMEVWLHCSHALGGIIALSPRLQIPKEPILSNEKLKDVPLFICHGVHDPLIPFHETKTVVEFLQEKHFQIDWHEYQMEHEIDPLEMQDLREWINEQI